jgi:hypothetical protein
MTEPPVTNLTEKFDALALQLAAQHTELLAALTELRGTGGPETTLRSINQSLWNLAGTAPGATLLEILNEISDMRGVGGPTGKTQLSDFLSLILSDSNGALLTEIRDSIGKLSQYPEFYTIKRLLAVIAGNIDAPIVGMALDPGLCTMPDDGTATLLMETHRITDWQMVDSFMDGNGYTNYVPKFPIIEGATGIIHQMGGNYDGKDMLNAVLWDYWSTTPHTILGVYACVQWDFTNDTVYPFYSTFSNTEVGNGTVTAQGGNSLDLPKGSSDVRFRRSTAVGASAVGNIVFAVPTGSVMPNNVFVSMWASTTWAY